MSLLDGAIAIIKVIDADFGELVTALYARRFTGYTGVHWLNGVPRQVDLPGTTINLTKTVDKRTNLPEAVAVAGRATSRA